jgi:hypothetical protein
MTLVVTRSHISCGVREVFGIQGYNEGSFYYSPKLFIKHFWDGCNDPSWERKFRFALFSTREVEFKVLDDVTKYITDNELGTVMRSAVQINPNSGNNIQVCMWDIDWNNLKAFIAKEFPSNPIQWVKAQVTVA